MKRMPLTLTALAGMILGAAASGDEMTPRVLEGHTGSVYSLAFSPGGKTLASAGEDGTIRLWDTETARAGRALAPARGGRIRALAFAPHGRALASGHTDGTIFLWDAIAGRVLGTFREHNKAVLCLAFSPDGKLLASASVDQTARLWDARTRRLLRTLAHRTPVTSVAFSPSGRELATGSGRTAVIWSVTGGREVRALTHRQDVQSLAFSPDGKALATGSWTFIAAGLGGGELKTWDLGTGKQLREIFTPMGKALRIDHVTFLPDRKTLVFTVGRLASASNIVLWDLEKNQERQRLADGPVSALAVSPDGKKLASACYASTEVRLRDLKPSEEKPGRNRRRKP